MRSKIIPIVIKLTNLDAVEVISISDPTPQEKLPSEKMCDISLVTYIFGKNSQLSIFFS
jgi:hypothetical protein